MASLKGQLVSQTQIKSDGDVFHELFCARPHHISSMSPRIQGCDLHDGDWGKQGSVIFWNFTHALITVQVTKLFVELYKTFDVTLHVDTPGWTVDYEKKSADIPEPTTLMDFVVALTKDIETHHLTNI